MLGPKEDDMSEIYAMPPETRAGLSFDYSVWSAGSVITMVNVPFDNTYRAVSYTHLRAHET